MKKFMSNQELICYLLSKNLIINDKEKALQCIEKYSYYSIINGYKAVFKNEDNSFKSVHKALQIFSSDNVTDFHLLDMIDYIKNITSKDLYDFYLRLINKSSADIFITSSTDEKELNKVIKKYYPFKNTSLIKEDNSIEFNFSPFISI